VIRLFKVLKKDGSTEDFDWKKLTGGVMKAGASQEEADKVATIVELWLSTIAGDSPIVSNELHKQILKALREVNSQVADGFEAYRKPED
jgi:transcriptional regulator NrdR family protein